MPNTVACHRVVVTGAAGHLGRGVVRGLAAAGHRVLATDIRDAAPAGASEFRVVDIGDAAALAAAFAGQEVVIHLAAVTMEQDFLTQLVPANYIGVYQVFEAARQARVARLIVASTVMVVQGQAQAHCQVGVAADYAPLDHYAVSKVMMEAMGRLYATQHGLAVLVVRLGCIPRNSATMRMIGRHAHMRNYYLSHDDAARFFVAALAVAPRQLPAYCVVYVVSRGPRASVGVDRAPAERWLNYVPRDLWPAGTAVYPVPTWWRLRRRLVDGYGLRRCWSAMPAWLRRQVKRLVA